MSTTFKRTGTNPVYVEAHPDTLLRLRRMARELRLTDQMLSLDIDSLTVVNMHGQAPAWTTLDGSAITINAGKMPELKGRHDVAVWLGTNAHELFHNLFSPRSESKLIRRLRAAEQSFAPGMHHTWNVLEDQRIERLGLLRYWAWRGYLIAALAHHIPVNSPESYLLIAGRTWLSAETRQLARAMFLTEHDEHEAQLAARLIGAYQRLVDPAEDDSDAAFDIVTEFHEAFRLSDRGSCGRSLTAAGDPEPGDGGDDSVLIPTADEAEQEEADDESDDDESDDDESDGDDGSSVATNDDGDDDEHDGDGDEYDGDGEGDDDGDRGDEADDDGDGEVGGEASDDSDESGDDGDESDDVGDAADGDEGGEGVAKPDGQERTIEGALADDRDEALEDDETADDLDRVTDQVQHGSPGDGIDLRRTTGTWHEATETAMRLSHGVADVLAEIRDDCEAAWVRRVDHGRFSVHRWATDPDWDADNVFDVFDPGAMDASSLDCVLVVDVSGSMHTHVGQLAEAVWAIRTAIDRIEGKCVVLGFGDSGSLMFDAHERPDGRLFVPDLENSTDPIGALRQAHHVVANSAATNRVVITLTDGAWWNSDEAVPVYAAIAQQGATAAIVGLGWGARHVTPGFCGVDLTRFIKEPGELVDFFREVAEQSMRQAAGL